MLTRLFCNIDDFYQVFMKEWEGTLLSNQRRRRSCCISHSEIMTILVHYHQSGYRTFKWYYQKYVQSRLQRYFPKLPSYQRLVELMPRVIMPLTLFMRQCCVSGRGIAFIDSTPLRVCDNVRIPSHRTFVAEAGRGKSSTGWFYGFKLHLVMDDCGNIISFSIAPGNTDDRVPVPTLLKQVTGKVFGDRGYISKKLQGALADQGVELITTLKKNMKKVTRNAFDQLLLRKRSIIETINDQLKNISEVEHTRHRSLTNYMINIVCGLISYSYQEKKPSLNLHFTGLVAI